MQSPPHSCCPVAADQLNAFPASQEVGRVEPAQDPFHDLACAAQGGRPGEVGYDDMSAGVGVHQSNLVSRGRHPFMIVQPVRAVSRSASSATIRVLEGEPSYLLTDAGPWPNTLVVNDGREQVLAQRRLANDRAGCREMKTFVRDYRDRVWAVEGARGVGVGLAQRLVAEGEQVLNVAAKLSAWGRARWWQWTQDRQR
jgi:hypothetical protein